MTDSASARVRAGLNHPVIDADGHWLELQPVFLDYFVQIAGPKNVDRYLKSVERDNSYDWYRATSDERARNRMKRPPWWVAPNHPLDRTAAMVPALFRERLDDWGIDFSIVYPSLGLNLPRMQDAELRRALVRAYNTMAADLFKPYADRMTPAGVCPMNTPEEAMEEADYAVRTLGLKVLVMNCTVRRPILADADWQPDLSKRRTYFDSLALDSPYDYDPVWHKLTSLRVAVTNHMGSQGWPDRSSTTNFVADHLGHFAQSHHVFARSLFLGGVTERFPSLTFGFLEGGVGWACNLYADLIGHWKKRNKKSMHESLKPTNLDRTEVRRIMEHYSRSMKCLEGKIDDILARNLFCMNPYLSQEELAERDLESDDFSSVSIGGPDDIRRLFARNFYFGCEADDPITAWAFDKKSDTLLKPVLGSDVSHFDVVDASKVLSEAWEMVERGAIDAENFRSFVFSNTVELHGRMNPEFFAGTAIETEARRELEAFTSTGSREGSEPPMGVMC
mgnify:CR=1 FL=1